MGVRLLHLADLHLGWEPRFLPPEKAEAWRRERDGLLDLADEVVHRERVNLVVIAGDLFEDYRPPPALVERVLVILRRWEAAGVHVVTVPGNHDEITYRDSVYRVKGSLWPGLLVRSPLPAHAGNLEVAGRPVHVYGLAFTGGETPGRLDSFPPAGGEGLHLAVFHGSLDWEGGDRSPVLSGRGLAAAGYHYVALGHLHVHRVQRLGGTTAAYAGAVAGKGFDDPGEGMWTLVDLEEGSPPRVRRLPAPCRPVRVLRLDTGPFRSADELAETLAGLAEGEAIVRFRLEGVPGGRWDTEAVAEAMGRRFFHAELEDATEGVSEAVLASLEKEETVAGAFVRRLLARAAQASDEAERDRCRRALLVGLAALGLGRDHPQEGLGWR